MVLIIAYTIYWQTKKKVFTRVKAWNNRNKISLRCPSWDMTENCRQTRLQIKNMFKEKIWSAHLMTLDIQSFVFKCQYNYPLRFFASFLILFAIYVITLTIFFLYLDNKLKSQLRISFIQQISSKRIIGYTLNNSILCYLISI